MFSGLPGSKQKIGQSFARGTTLAFWQASAPIGWTKITTQNDALLRVVSGVGGPLGGGGANAFSTVNAQTVVGSTTLSSAQMPVHSHSDAGHAHTQQEPVTGGGATWATGGSGTSATVSGPSTLSASANIQNAGSGGSHNHTISMSILYVDMILASKN